MDVEVLEWVWHLQMLRGIKPIEMFGKLLEICVCVWVCVDAVCSESGALGKRGYLIALLNGCSSLGSASFSVSSLL